MYRCKMSLMALLACSLYGAPAFADKACSVKQIAGNWVFATGIGRQMLGFPPDSDITAIGTMNINADGTLDGIFDFTVENIAPFSDITYTGTVTVGPDCRGTLVFVTSFGSSRIDSIVVVDRTEILGMSRDPANLWTYQVRRLEGHRDGD